MQVKIYEESGFIKDINKIINTQHTAVISFTDEDVENVDFSKYPYLKCIKCSVDGLWFDEIGDETPYKKSFAKIGKFVLDCNNKKINTIICQYVHGQNRSAACAAAITEYYNHDGIKIFADYKYSPNHYFYNGIYNALVSLKKGY